MSVLNAIVQNEYEWQIRGEFSLSSGAAVSGLTTSGASITKTTTGTYTITIFDRGLKLVKLAHREANFSATVPATVANVYISTVTQNADGTISIVVLTTASVTSSTPADTTAACVVDFEVVIVTNQMSVPL